MLQAVLGSFILIGIYKFMNSKSEYKVDAYIAGMFIFVPGILIFFISIGLNMLNINPGFSLLGYLLYFFFPLLFLKLSLEYQTKPAIKFSSVVPIVAIVTEIPFAILMAPNA